MLLSQICHATVRSPVTLLKVLLSWYHSLPVCKVLDIDISLPHLLELMWHVANTVTITSITHRAVSDDVVINGVSVVVGYVPPKFKAVCIGTIRQDVMHDVVITFVLIYVRYQYLGFGWFWPPGHCKLHGLIVRSQAHVVGGSKPEVVRLHGFQVLHDVWCIWIFNFLSILKGQR